jgi:hypothetical protein
VDGAEVELQQSPALTLILPRSSHLHPTKVLTADIPDQALWITKPTVLIKQHPLQQLSRSRQLSLLKWISQNLNTATIYGIFSMSTVTRLYQHYWLTHLRGIYTNQILPVTKLTMSRDPMAIVAYQRVHRNPLSSLATPAVRSIELLAPHLIRWTS